MFDIHPPATRTGISARDARLTLILGVVLRLRCGVFVLCAYCLPAAHTPPLVSYGPGNGDAFAIAAARSLSSSSSSSSVTPGLVSVLEMLACPFSSRDFLTCLGLRLSHEATQAAAFKRQTTFF